MTTITAYTALDMTDTATRYGDVLSASSSKIVISDGYQTGVYTGSFKYSDNALSGGTLKGYSAYAGGVIQYKITGGSVSVVLAADIINSGDSSQLLEIVLAGNDKITGSANDDTLLGYTGNDTLAGGAGADALNGGEGNDKMMGGTGDDQYAVDSVKDTVTEKINEGYDTVFSSVSYTLGNNVEELQLANGAGNLFGMGNKGNNIILGNDGNNILSGMEGNDELQGHAGNDSLYGEAGNDTLYGETGNDSLTGGVGDDQLAGGDGNDSLTGDDGDDSFWGEAGNDTLTGGAGTDFFQFVAPLNATNNVDIITDFISYADYIYLDAKIFNVYTSVDAGNIPYHLPAADFSLAPGGIAFRPTNHILYDTDTGKLYYDPDGSGSQAAIQFATLTGSPILLLSHLLIF